MPVKNSHKKLKKKEKVAHFKLQSMEKALQIKSQEEGREGISRDREIAT